MTKTYSEQSKSPLNNSATTLPPGRTYGRVLDLWEYDGFQFVHARHQPFESVGLHDHACGYLCINLGASFVESDRRGHQRVLDVSVAAAHPQGAAHANKFGADGGACLSVFEKTSKGRLWNSATRALSISQHQSVLRIRHSIAAISTGDRSPCAANSFEISEQIHDLLHAFMFGEDSGKRNASGVYRALEAIQDAPLEEWTVARLASIANLHPNHLVRQTRLNTGRSLGEHLRARRLMLAATLLRNSHDSISSIAAYCGFADQAHLTRWMRRVVGATPRSYRRS